MKKVLLAWVAVCLLAFSACSRETGTPVPFSLRPGQAERDLRENIARGEYRLPILGGAPRLRFAPFLADPNNYSGVNGGHVVFETDGPPGQVVAYVEAYWRGYLPALREKGLLHVYEAKVQKAAAFAAQEASAGRAKSPPR